MDSVSDLEKISAAARGLGEESTVAGALGILDRLTATLVGHRMFTALLFHADTQETERFYTNQVAKYPLQGRKPPRQDRWSEAVIGRGEIFLVPDQSFLKENFADAATLIGLGLGSGMCLPVRSGGRTLGTINVFDAPQKIAAKHAVFGRIIAGLAVPAFQAQQNSA